MRPPTKNNPAPGHPTADTQTDPRRMCFQQGKAVVYMPPGDDSRIVTEYPNGVVEDYDLASKSITRTWPDGRLERFRDGDTADFQHPYVPPPA